MPEIRKDPIVDRWVIISTERGKRPQDFPSPVKRIKKGSCPFCAGNESMTPPEILAVRPEGTSPNQTGWTLRVVENKYPALTLGGAVDRVGEGMFDKMNGVGTHEVIIESPDHEMDLELLSERRVEDCLWAFRKRILDLKNDPRFRYILIFKNHGDSAGASLEHTHCQLVALPIVPELVSDELAGSKRHHDYKERCIFCDMIAQEQWDGKRIVVQNEKFVTLCPYAPRFPFETWLLPRYHSARFESNGGETFPQLAEIFKETLLRMRMALNVPPYNFVIHTAPLQGNHEDHFHWHIEIMPKLTRQAGFEQGTGFYINPVLPEEAADVLRKVKL
ncbi:MAG: galactose-1-phosphate uridylyltransferase [Nitrospinae bacterium CG11_big_fil_rev_8_21_14_0_20_56_8]|nr:MAG: galactose-1-phosphate uridylyltransferase [Nitrospinae bacterium CG11_big_fil_rev_8_21_14_0_20_56_8]